MLDFSPVCLPLQVDLDEDQRQAADRQPAVQLRGAAGRRGAEPPHADRGARQPAPRRLLPRHGDQRARHVVQLPGQYWRV